MEEKHIFFINQGPYKGICNPQPLLPDINVHTKFEERSNGSEGIT